MPDSSIFKACDVRGRYGVNLTPTVAHQLGLAVGSEIPGQTLVVGGDVRPSTSPLKTALIEGLVETGCRVLDVGIVPTPTYYFAAKHLRTDGGVQVTGSHNPAPDNGFKISLARAPITEEQLARLARRMAENRFELRPGGCVERQDVTAAYKDFIRNRFAEAGQRAVKPRIVVDCGNGTYSRLAPEVLKDLGYETIDLFCEPDGTFPNRPPNPAVAANLQALRETVLATGAHLGAAYDGDGDRVVFVDERGRVIENDRSIVLFARHLLAAGEIAGTPYAREVIYDIKCSSAVPEEVRRAGGVPVMEKSGHLFIRTSLLERRAIFGGEISGHFFFGDLGGDDGLYATLLMLQIVAENGGSLAALADSVPRYPITPDLRLPCPPERAQALVREVFEAFQDEPGCEVSLLDGARVAWDDGWALVRPSVTEPLMTLRFEAHTAERLAEIRQTVAVRVPELGRLMAG